MKAKVKVDLVSREQAANIFKGRTSSMNDMRPLRSKGKPLSDVGYFKLLGAYCRKLESENPNPRLSPDYAKLGFDPACVKVAKNIVDMAEEGFSEKEMQHYINQCVIYN